MFKITDQPSFELMTFVLRKALANMKNLDPRKILIWNTFGDYDVTNDELFTLIKSVDLTAFNEENQEPISEVTLQDVEFIFYDRNWHSETVGSLIPYLMRLVAYKKLLKHNRDDVGFIRSQKHLHDYMAMHV